MFDLFTYAQLRAAFYAAYSQAMTLASDHHELIEEVWAEPDHDTCRDMLATSAVILAAIAEQQELIHAIRLETCRRNAETEQAEMGLSDD